MNDTTSFYGQYAVGNNPAGVNVGFFNPGIIASLNEANALFASSGGTEGVPYTVENLENFEEEELQNIELGIKGSALDGRLQYATAIYSMKWKDNVQPVNLYWGPLGLPPPLQDPNDGNRTFVNNGDQKMKGIEFEANFLVGDNWSVRGTLGLLDAEYTDYCDIGLFNGLGGYAESVGKATLNPDGAFAPCYIVNGNEAKEQPEITVSLSPSFRTQLSNGLGLRVAERITSHFTRG